MSNPSAALQTASAAHRQAKAGLAKARENLRVLSHAALAGNARVSETILAAAAVKVAQWETLEHSARLAAMPPANPNA